MRSNEERIAAVKRRVAQRERQKQQRRKRLAVLASVAASLAVIVGAALAMPGFSEKLTAGDYAGYEAAASMFSAGAAGGYLLIGLLAFGLGVCVTALCVKLRAFSTTDEEGGRRDDRAS